MAFKCETMSKRPYKWLIDWITNVLVKDPEPDPVSVPLIDFERLCEELRQGDVLLVEGRTRVSHVIKLVTQSPWTHSALYIGRLDDIKDVALQEKIREHYDGDPREQLLFEALLGEGAVINPVNKYHREHLRICRPQGLTRADTQRVIAYALTKLGYDYDVRHLLDLARFLYPYALLPRRWRSSLFKYNLSESTRTVCSSMMAEAFGSVQFPILPVAERHDDGTVRLYRRNTQLYTPKDFDYSPYFDIIKYPYLGLDEVATYRRLPWDQEGLICNAEGDCFIAAETIGELESEVQRYAIERGKPDPAEAASLPDDATSTELGESEEEKVTSGTK